MSGAIRSLLIGELLQGYRAGRYTPVDVMSEVLERLASAPERHVWIARFPVETLLERARELLTRSPQDLPLYGIPFAVKDNIDLAGLPTTAGCPAFAYAPEASASVVAKLVAAGALPIGKTNLDQFATGLVGTRSPYGACVNAFDARYVSGGSSSGSAVAVATGLVSFALGTDTAGSGRVPAAFNNLVGLKPSCGRLSTRGVVPACRTLDCVSIFALTAADAARVFAVAEGFDPLDPYSRDYTRPPATTISPDAATFRFAVPLATQLEFFGDARAEEAYAVALRRLEALGGTRVEIDFAPFAAAARLLYEGPWVAERYAAIEPFMRAHKNEMLPVTRAIIAAGAEPSAAGAEARVRGDLAHGRGAGPADDRHDPDRRRRRRRSRR
jgi:allophanate hydrolase